jgi:hypothetical protein
MACSSALNTPPTCVPALTDLYGEVPVEGDVAAGFGHEACGVRRHALREHQRSLAGVQILQETGVLESWEENTCKGNGCALRSTGAGERRGKVESCAEKGAASAGLNEPPDMKSEDGRGEKEGGRKGWQWWVGGSG